MILPDAPFDLWGAVLAFLFTANMALVGIIYHGVVRRLDRTDKILANMAGGFVALATTLSPDKAPKIIEHFVSALIKREGN